MRALVFLHDRLVSVNLSVEELQTGLKSVGSWKHNDPVGQRWYASALVDRCIAGDMQGLFDV